MAPEDRETIRRILDVTEKLLHETRRLRGDVCRLVGRIEPYEQEAVINELPLIDASPKTLKEAFGLIARARRDLQNVEYDIAFIRGRMDEISSDAISRSEMKPWLKDDRG